MKPSKLRKTQDVVNGQACVGGAFSKGPQGASSIAGSVLPRGNVSESKSSPVVQHCNTQGLVRKGPAGSIAQDEDLNRIMNLPHAAN